MDVATVRLLSIHISALLPPTSTELDVPHNVQVAAVMGIGLIYQGTANRHIAEILLQEIGDLSFSISISTAPFDKLSNVIVTRIV
jgi:anaphase-promoting complex subunit 1